MTDRRDFCKSALKVVGACSLGSAFLLQACGTTQALTSDYTVENKNLNILLSAFTDKKHLVFDDNKLELPVYVSKISETEYRAFLMRCTHRGCTIQASGSIMVCPCHGAEFSNKGEVLSGPANEPLYEFKTTKTETTLNVILE